MCDISSRPYASTAVETTVRENFDRANQVVSLTVDELQTNGARARRSSPRSSSSTPPRWQETLRQPVSAAPQTGVSNMNFVKETATQQVDELHQASREVQARVAAPSARTNRLPGEAKKLRRNAGAIFFFSGQMRAVVRRLHPWKAAPRVRAHPRTRPEPEASARPRSGRHRRFARHRRRRSPRTRRVAARTSWSITCAGGCRCRRDRRADRRPPAVRRRPKPADVSKYEEVRSEFERVRRAYGRLDIVVNNAGILRDRTFKKMHSAIGTR